MGFQEIFLNVVNAIEKGAKYIESDEGKEKIEKAFDTIEEVVKKTGTVVGGATATIVEITTDIVSARSSSDSAKIANSNIIKAAPTAKQTTCKGNDIKSEHEDYYNYNEPIGTYDYDSDGEITIDGGYDKYGYPEGENPYDD